MTIIDVYAPEEGNKTDTEISYDRLQKQIDKVNKNDHVIICGDFSARVGSTPIPYTVRNCGEQRLNNNGRQLRHNTFSNKMEITDTSFRKRNMYKNTWNARDYRSTIDYFFLHKQKLRSQLRHIEAVT